MWPFIRPSRTILLGRVRRSSPPPLGALYSTTSSALARNRRRWHVALSATYTMERPYLYFGPSLFCSHSLGAIVAGPNSRRVTSLYGAAGGCQSFTLDRGCLPFSPPLGIPTTYRLAVYGADMTCTCRHNRGSTVGMPIHTRRRGLLCHLLHWPVLFYTLTFSGHLLPHFKWAHATKHWASLHAVGLCYS